MELCVGCIADTGILFYRKFGYASTAEKDQYGGVHEIHRVKNLVLYDHIIK